MNPISIGVCGLGTVGQGVLKVLNRNGVEIARRVGRDLRVTQVASRSGRGRPETDSIAFTNDVMAVAANPDIDVLVEVIGGVDTAYDLVTLALQNGKHVVTANKALIAERGNELFALADQKGVTLAYEASVAGGIPIVKAIREGLAGNRIDWLAGIINGTSNFILTQMEEEGADFGETLAQAQELGYAEEDPSFDIGGIDAAHKLTILSSIAFGVPLRFDRVYIEGIESIAAEDIEYARQLGYRVKHLGITALTDEGISLRVHPALVPREHLLASVNGVMNAVYVESDAVGPSMYYGPGAGSEPTASAVVADIIDVARATAGGNGPLMGALGFAVGHHADTPSVPMTAVKTAYYLRIPAFDEPGVLAQIARILSEEGISIEAVIQKERREDTATGSDPRWVPIIILTHQVTEESLNRAVSSIEQLDEVPGKVTRIRVESLR